MKTRRLFAFLATLSLAGAAQASILTYTPLTPLDILPGGSVTFQIEGQSVNSIGGFSLYLDSDTPVGWIDITSATLNTALFAYGGPSPTFPEAISSTDISQDLGAFSNSPLSAGTPYLLTTVTVTFDASTPAGTYTVGNTAATVFTDPGFTLSDFASVAGFQIHVVPEPVTGALLAAGMAALVLGRRKRAAV